MFAIYGVLLLVIIIFLLHIWIHNEGVLCLFSYGRIGLIIWTFALGLYDLNLSELYNPDLLINIMGTIVILNYFLLLKIIPNDNKKFVDICKNIETPKRGFLIAVYFTLFLGIMAFVKNLNSGLLRYFISNKGMRAEIQSSYFFAALVVVSICFYILFREEKRKHRKYVYLLLAVISIFMEFTNMARGPILFWIVGVVFYEVTRYSIKQNSLKLSYKQLIVILLIILIGIWGFGEIGDSRVKTVFGMTATEYYKMPAKCPSGVTWVYIYLTSPMENMRYSFHNDTVSQYGYFNKLLYPAIKFIANIIGQGNQYSYYVNSINSITPYLWNKVGLNMSSFMANAYLDAGYLGIIVYLFIYDVIGVIAHKITISKTISNISKIIILPLLFEIPLWSVFTSSILGVSSIWSNIFFVLIWNLGNRIILKRRN